MTRQQRDYDDILRRALRAAAESVEPAADGLDRIRGRLSASRVGPFVLFTEFLHWLRSMLLWIESGSAGARSGLQALGTRLQLPARARQVLGRIQPALAALRRQAARAQPALAALRRQAARAQPALAAMGSKAAPQRPCAAHRTQPPPTGLRARLNSAFTRLAPAASWLRPVFAVAGAVAIVVAGVFALGQAQQFITPANQITGHSGTPHKTTPPATTAPRVVPIGPATTPPATGSATRVQQVPTCLASPTPKPTRTTPATSPAPTPSKTPTPTPTPTVSATPTVSPTVSVVPGTGAGQVAAAAARLLPVPCVSASAKAS
jgi:hypothetical protein